MRNSWRFLLLILLAIAISTTYQLQSKNSDAQETASFTPNDYEFFTPTTTSTSNASQTIDNEVSFEEVYPQLSGNGIILSKELLTQTEENKQYLEIIYLSNLIESYPIPSSQVISQQEKDTFKEYLLSNIESSQYNDLLYRKYQEYDLNHYLDNYLVKHFGLYNQQTKSNEKIQCLGWFAVVSDLIISHYETNRLAGINHYNILFPDEIFRIKNKGDITVIYPKTFDDLDPGDVYIYGHHIGIILDIFSLNGQEYYLISEANSPKGAEDFYKPNGDPTVYIADQTKFLQAVGLRDLYILRPTHRAERATPNTSPNTDFQNLIAILKGD